MAGSIWGKAVGSYVVSNAQFPDSSKGGSSLWASSAGLFCESFLEVQPRACQIQPQLSDYFVSTKFPWLNPFLLSLAGMISVMWALIYPIQYWSTKISKREIDKTEVPEISSKIFLVSFLCQTKGVHNQARARLNVMCFVFVFKLWLFSKLTNG